MSVFEQVEIKKHGVIEASAGTGKTYTIEQLFLRILCTQNIAIDKILVLTYTEKATSELKMRIRSGIETLLKKSDGKQREQLEQALDCFDLASIHTIHGFCNRVLSEYAFENRSLFEANFVDENSLVEGAYREVLRSELPLLGAPAQLLMELAQWDTRSFSGYRFDDTVFELARRVRKENGDQVEPKLEILDVSLQRIQSAIENFSADFEGEKGRELLQWYESLPFHSRSREANLRNAIEPLIEIFEEFVRDQDPYASLIRLIPIERWLGSRGGARLRPNKYNKGFTEDLETQKRLERLVDGLEEILKPMRDLSGGMAVFCVDKIYKAAEKIREEEAQHSFQDLIEGVRIAVRDPDSELVKRLREQYAFALIDEFQDTDPGQWEILRRVFLEKGSRSKLYLVGDPKQAIYAFRGADLATYERAVGELKELDGQAKLYSLEQNFRSAPQFLEPLNQLFSQECWFGDTRYSVKVSAPEEGLQRHGLQCFPKARKPLNLVCLEAQSQDQNLNQLAGFIADEIRFLNENPEYQLLDGNSSRKGNWGDFCVLIRSRTELTYLKQAFRDIPHFVYKKPGVFCSLEALELSCLLRAIARPLDQAGLRLSLMTSFLDWTLFDLDSLRDSHIAERMHSLFGRWREMALREDWGNLFFSLLRETRLGPSGARDPGWEERVSIFTQIMETLLIEARRRSLDLASMVEFLNRLYHRDEVLGEEASYHRLVEEEGKVRIMTIHASKGLEFPVVFLLNLFKDGPKSLVHHPRAGNQGYQYYLSSPPEEARELFDAEHYAGMKRLYYVAFTRAQHALYLPFFTESQEETGRTKQRRISRFYQDIVHPALSSLQGNPHQGYLEIGMDRSTEWNHGSLCRSARVREGWEADEPGFSLTRLEPGFLYPLKGIDLFSRSGSGIESFSSLRKRVETGNQYRRVLSFSEKWSEPEEGAEFIGATQESEELPGGWQVGSMLHEILENLDFQRMDSIPGIESDYQMLLKEPSLSFFPDLVLRCCSHFGISQHLIEEVTRLVWCTLTTPIDQVDSGFRILRLHPHKMIREPEFFLSLSEELFLLGSNISAPGYLHGFIDLVFEHEDKVYLVDWKSNRINEGYHHQALESLMEEEDYVLQYQIYSLALLRWLKWKLGDKFSYENHFGGILYLFLRGMNPANGEGVYFYRPSREEEIHRYLDIILERNRKAGEHEIP